MIGPGSQIGSYRLIERLGRGGMGVVYLAEHMALGKQVALKMLRPDTAGDADAVSRFFTEARAVNMIRHEHIVEVNDFGTAQTGEIYYVMELLSGASLYQHVQRHEPFSLSRTLHVGVQVADALAASHAVGVVHRDLKPENIILIERSSDKDYVKVLDFGLAKLMRGNEGSLHQTQTGAVMGSPLYMSPEQCVGSPLIDHRTDIYSLGIILFELVTGRVPFEGKSWGELVLLHSSAPFPSVRTLKSSLPARFEAILEKAAAKSADARFQHMAELREALLGLIDSAGKADRLRSSKMPVLAPPVAAPAEEEGDKESTRVAAAPRISSGKRGIPESTLEDSRTISQAVTAHISRPMSGSSDRTMANVHQASTQPISMAEDLTEDVTQEPSLRRPADPQAQPYDPPGDVGAAVAARSSQVEPTAEQLRDTALVRPSTVASGAESHPPPPARGLRKPQLLLLAALALVVAGLVVRFVVVGGSPSPGSSGLPPLGAPVATPVGPSSPSPTTAAPARAAGTAVSPVAPESPAPAAHPGAQAPAAGAARTAAPSTAGKPSTAAPPAPAAAASVKAGAPAARPGGTAAATTATAASPSGPAAAAKPVAPAARPRARSDRPRRPRRPSAPAPAGKPLNEDDDVLDPRRR
jgi:serine/threonine protein kinase